MVWDLDQGVTVSDTRMGWAPARAATIALVVIALLGLPAPARPARCEIEVDRNRYGTWATIPLPETPRAEIDVDNDDQYDDRRDVDSYAVDLHDSSTIYVADQYTVMRSTDGGCHWSKTFSVLDGGALAPHTDHIVSLTAAPALSGARVYALIQEGAKPSNSHNPSATVPRLAVLGRSGEWEVREPVLAETGGPLVGEAARLWVGPAPGRLYMLVNDRNYPGFPGPAVYVSDDDGANWELRGIRGVNPNHVLSPCPADGLCIAIDYRTLVPDPAEPDTLWVASWNEVLRSEDAGRTWQTVFRWDEHGGNSALAVFRPRGRPPTIVVLAAWEMAWSGDGGTTWQTRPLSPAPASASGVGPHPRAIVYLTDASAGGGRAQMIGNRETVDVSLPSHGGTRPSSTRLRAAGYVPVAGSYFFMGGENDPDRGFRWGSALLRFTPHGKAGR